MLDLSSLDLEEAGDALAGQTDCGHRWLINPQTGEITFWTAGTGIDGQTPGPTGRPAAPHSAYRDAASFSPDRGRAGSRALRGELGAHPMTWSRRETGGGALHSRGADAGPVRE